MKITMDKDLHQPEKMKNLHTYKRRMKKEAIALCTGNGTGRIHGFFKIVFPWSLSGITGAGRAYG